LRKRKGNKVGLGDAIFQIPDAILGEGFGRIPVCLMRVPEVSPAAKYVYACLLYYAWKLEYFPGQIALSQEFHVPRRSLQRYLDELEHYGIITRFPPPSTGELSVIRINELSEWRVPNWPTPCAKMAHY
jgi:hypothetical protein